MALLEAHGAAMDSFDRVLRGVGTRHWRLPTPCREWTVRDLVNHLTAEQLWVPHLLAGATMDDVGGRFDGDVLGDDPLKTWERAAAAAREAFHEPGVLTRNVQVSTGLIECADYGWQMTIDLAVHAWDLATAIGQPNPIDAFVAAELLEVLRPQLDEWQGLGLFDPPVAVSRHADAPTRLVALLGRRPYRA
ncbi:TIGR03086 family metal-binding protein [Amycolatopsis sp. cg5]|uniref:TIGR03086 family metal-binding protein n=1 Tax=Amycolatopsis sp. cg5 TaxID=3238802 RepID=UPI003524D815